MGKKGCVSAIKRVFGANSKEKLDKGGEKKSSKEKKKGQGILKQERTKPFIPLFREPSSIEKILGEVDQQQLQYRPTPYDQPVTPTSFSTQPASPINASQRITSPRNESQRITSPRVASPRITSPRAASPRVTSPRAASPKATSPRVTTQRASSPRVYHPRPEPTLRNHHLSATKIQAVYRGYTARRSLRALRGLVRLQGVVRGHNVKRQTMNAMKNMQLLVRVQTQIQSQRIQMLENRVIQSQTYKNDGEAESTLGKWTLNSHAGDHEDWDDSLLTKEEVEARIQKKVEAAIKRERAMAYAYSNQLWKGHPKPGQMPLQDVRSGAFPWWWTWFDHQLPSTKPSETQTMKNFLQTPPKQTPDSKPSPRPQSLLNFRQHNSGNEILETPTPRSSRSTAPVKTRQMLPPSKTPPPSMRKYVRARNNAADSNTGGSIKDDDSLMSCPPFSVPHYMSPTVSAIAKARPNSNIKYQYPGTPTDSEAASKRRFSFPLAPSIGSFKWNKGSTKDLTRQNTVARHHQPAHSIGDRSVDSAVSMPAAIGRKPFNRFV